jgi:type I restriction enzyme M protein
LPAGRKNYSKTQPIQFEEFADCISWWPNRTENERAWRVPASDLLKLDDKGIVISVNLDVNNPNNDTALEHRSPEALVESILQKEQRIAELMGEIRTIVQRG